MDQHNENDEQQKLSQRKPQCRVSLKPMSKWLEEDTSYCRPCILPVTIDWYHQELNKRGYPELAQELDNVRMTLDSTATCELMDKLKDKLPLEVRHQLLEFDCATQEFAAEEEGVNLPDEGFQESSEPQSHNPDNE